MKLLDRIVLAVRPAAAAGGTRSSSVSTATLLGWYARKALGPGLRGLVVRLRLRARFPLFVGRGVSIHYARQIQAGRGVSLGDRVRILAYSRDGVRLGDRVTIRENGWIQCSSSPSNPGVGLTIGEDTYVGPGVVLGVGGPIDIGPRCQLGAGVTLIAENHAVHEAGVSATDVVRKGIAVGEGCWIGHRATLLDGVTLGRGCVVGAGAVVTKSFPAGTVLVGVPAREVSR